MVATDYHSHRYVVQLNQWHSQLVSLRDLIEHMLDVAEGPDWLLAGGSVAIDRFTHLVETLPFPEEFELHLEPEPPGPIQV